MEDLLYQTLVGAWPIATDRVLAYMAKAAREAKLHTSWTAPTRTTRDTSKSSSARCWTTDPFAGTWPGSPGRWWSRGS